LHVADRWRRGLDCPGRNPAGDRQAPERGRLTAVAENAQALLHRQQQMEDQRINTVESVWRDCFDYTYPIRGTGLMGSKDTAVSAQGRQSRLFDNTAAD